MISNEHKHINLIIEASLGELITYLRAASADPLLTVYCDALIVYLKADIIGLHAILQNFRSSFSESSKTRQDEMIETLIALRLQIRLRRVDRAFLDQFVIEIDGLPIAWKGEARFVAAMSYEVIEEHAIARTQYRLAALELEKSGAKRKSVKALLNSVASESRIDMDSKRFIADYFFIFRKASAVKEHGVAGVALYNISIEYQRIGAFSVALKFCNRALACLQSDFGTLQYYSTVVHRCHLLLQLGRVAEAEIDYQSAQVAPFLEIQAAIKLLDQYIEKGSMSFATPSENLLPTWRNRVEHSQKNCEPSRLGELENSFLRFISTKPRDKFEIIRYLYGDRVDFEQLENRFKALLSRTRKKRPELIVFENGKYRIVDKELLSAEAFETLENAG